MIFAGPLERARYQARIASRRIVFGTVGALFVLVGVVFVFVAIWLTMADVYGAKATALIFGGLWIGFGLAVLAFSNRRPRMIRTDATGDVSNVSPNPAAITAATLVNAFVVGIRAGRSGRRRRRRRD